MFDLKSPFKRQSKSPGSGDSGQEAAFSSISETRLLPRRSLGIGRYLAFSISDTYLQMAAARHVGRKRNVLDVRKVDIPPELDSIDTRTEFVSNTIGNYVSEFGGRHPNISVTVSGRETAFRTFLMPAMKARELDSAIPFEARKQIPFPFDDCVFDYRRISTIVSGDRTKYRIAAYAATKRYIKEQLEPFRLQGLVVSRVYHTHDVLGCLLRHLPYFTEEQNYTLIEVGHNWSEISFYRGSALQFFLIGTIGLSQLGDEPDDMRLDSFAESLVNEIQTSHDYYSGQYAKSFTNKVFVYGSLACNNSVLDLLNERTDFEFEPFPTDQLDFIRHLDSTFEDTHRACLPVVALSVCQARLPSLQPLEDRRIQSELRRSRIARFALALIAVVLVFSWAVMRKEIITGKEELSRLEQRIADIKTSEAYRAYHALKWQVGIDRSYVERTKVSPSHLSLSLKELSLLTPESIRLSRLLYELGDQKHNLTIVGVAASEAMPPEIILAEYVEALSASEFYQDVTILRHVKRKIEAGFEIEFNIGMNGVT